MNSLYDSKDTNKHTVCSFRTSINVKVLQWKNENIYGIISKMIEPDRIKCVATSNHQFKTNSTMKYTFDPQTFIHVSIFSLSFQLQQCFPQTFSVVPLVFDRFSVLSLHTNPLDFKLMSMTQSPPHGADLKGWSKATFLQLERQQ